MYNNVVSGVFNKFVKNDISCMRFNFRGVGHSTGNHTNGKGELSDVKACIDHLTQILQFDRLFICGYSYGAAIGCSAVNYSEKIIGYCAISFPWDYMGIEYKEFSQSTSPKLFIQGNKDTVAPYEHFMKHYNFYSEPKKFRIIEGADHFFQGFEETISKEVMNFYKSILP
jgi:alpha/beta superfamily hydrolase